MADSRGKQNTLSKQNTDSIKEEQVALQIIQLSKHCLPMKKSVEGMSNCLNMTNGRNICNIPLCEFSIVRQPYKPNGSIWYRCLIQLMSRTVVISYILIILFVTFRTRPRVNIIDWKFRLLSADGILLYQIYSIVKRRQMPVNINLSVTQLLFKFQDYLSNFESALVS